MDVYLNVEDYGAKNDGVTDSTNSIQQALDEASEKQVGVFFPGGIYLCKNLRVHPNTGIYGNAAWSYFLNGGTILQLSDDDAECIFDITDARGSTINGICMDGRNLGKSVHGIMFNREKFHKEEDGITIERCRISDFSGDACHLEKAWCMSLRHNMFCHSKGNGVYWTGWDGFIMDNWFSGNQQSGFYCDEWCCALTFTGNRIEWNKIAGFNIEAGGTISVGNCFFDRNGGPGLYFASDKGYSSEGIVVNGNVFNRNGAESKITGTVYDSHIYFKDCTGITCTSNTFKTGVDDDKAGKVSPAFGITIKNLSHCVIKDNVFVNGITESFINKEETHRSDLIIKDNTGTVFTK